MPAPAWDAARARAWLEGISWRGVYLDLERVSALAARLDNPERAFPSILIAGTNGKGSVAAILDSILGAAGITTGRYTSPHLIDWPERITVAGEAICWNDLARALQAVSPAADELEATPFEAFTAAAMWHFRGVGIEWGVIEVGLGGRLDATRICDAGLTVVTSIDRDHTAELGTGIEGIAREKGAIMRSGVPALFGSGTAAVREVLHELASALGTHGIGAEEVVTLQGCPVAPWGLAGDMRWEGPAADLARTLGEPEGFSWQLPLAGFHMLANLRTALAAVGLLRRSGLAIPTDAITRGITAVQWPGRMQFVPGAEGEPDLILDVAHNPAAAQALAGAIETTCGTRPLWLIVALAGDKDLEGFLAPLIELARGLTATTWTGERARSPDEIAAVVRALPGAPADLVIETAGEPAAALRMARERLGRRGLVLVTGSHLLVGPILTEIDLPAGQGAQREISARDGE